MALLKNIQYPNGTASNYHKISDLRLSQITNTTPVPFPNDGMLDEKTKLYRITVNVDSYVSQAIREQDIVNYLHSDTYRLTATADEVESKPIMEVAYAALKKTETFADAENA